MSFMFTGATAFNQNIGSWTLNASVTMASMLNSSGMNCANYASTLIGWNASGPNSRTLGATGRTFGTQANAAKANLVLATGSGGKGWTITDAGASSGDCGAFVTTWNMATSGSGSGQLQFGVTVGASALSYSWTSTGSPSSGTGTIAANTNANVTLSSLSTTGTLTLNLGTAGTQTQLRRFFINNGTDRSRLTNVTAWGTATWTSMENAFRGCNNLNITATDLPNLSGVTNMFRMFLDCTTLNGPSNINSWNTAAVTNMQGMFNSTAFNQNIGAWNTAAVTNMSHMFYSATAFNQNLGSWNTAAVTNMGNMFNLATAFNQNIGSWTLNATVTMASMLNSSGLSVANYDAILTAWNTSGPNGRSLGSAGLFYCASTANRANLVAVKGWTITGDNQGGDPTLVGSGNTITAPLNCGFSYYNSSNPAQKVISLNPNGNTFSPTSITINNNNVGTLPSGVSSVSGYYQRNNGTNTMRVSNRIHSIEAPGTYTTNGGIIVRVYFNAAEHTAMTSNAAPAGTIVNSGWYKSSINNAAGVVADITAESLSNSVNITPTSTGTESGMAFAEFLVTSFSSFGFFAKTTSTALPINLISFTAFNKACNENIIKWTSADEVNFSHYNLEWSADGNTFSTIAKIKGKGEINGLNSYSFNHNSKADINIYRLKSIDMNGTFAYSSIANSKNANCNGSTTIALMPNPTEGLVNIVYENEEPITVKVYQIDGKLLNTIELNAGNKSIDLSAYKSGVYSFVILSNGAIIKTERILKM